MFQWLRGPRGSVYFANFFHQTWRFQTGMQVKIMIIDFDNRSLKEVFQSIHLYSDACIILLYSTEDVLLALLECQMSEGQK